QAYARAVRREPPHQPRTVYPDAWIGTPDAATQDGGVVDRPCRTAQRGGGECLRFARDPPAAPHRERDEPLAPQTPESGHAMHDPHLEIALGQSPSERGQHDVRDGGLHRRERLELVPERFRIVQAIQRHLAQRGVMLREYERGPPPAAGPPGPGDTRAHPLLP